MSDAMLGPITGVLGPSEKPGNRSTFTVALVVLVPRLCVEARSDHHGRVLHHPDVQFVIDHHLGWRARHGLR